MGDITILSSNGEQWAAQNFAYSEWCQMKFKQSKNSSLFLRKGKESALSFFIGSERIPALIQHCKVWAIGTALTDRLRGREILNQLKTELLPIEEFGLPRKLKVWILQFALVPWVTWPFQVYDVLLTLVEQMEQMISAKVRTWLEVPRSFKTNALYANNFIMSLPIK